MYSYIYGMSRDEYKAFLVEHAEAVFEELLPTHSFLLDNVVLSKLREEADRHAEQSRDYWEAC